MIVKKGLVNAMSVSTTYSYRLGVIRCFLPLMAPAGRSALVIKIRVKNVFPPFCMS